MTLRKLFPAGAMVLAALAITGTVAAEGFDSDRFNNTPNQYEYPAGALQDLGTSSPGYKAMQQLQAEAIAKTRDDALRAAEDAATPAIDSITTGATQSPRESTEDMADRAAAEDAAAKDKALEASSKLCAMSPGEANEIAGSDAKAREYIANNNTSVSDESQIPANCVKAVQDAMKACAAGDAEGMKAAKACVGEVVEYDRPDPRSTASTTPAAETNPTQMLNDAANQVTEALSKNPLGNLLGNNQNIGGMLQQLAQGGISGGKSGGDSSLNGNNDDYYDYPYDNYPATSCDKIVDTKKTSNDIVTGNTVITTIVATDTCANGFVRKRHSTVFKSMEKTKDIASMQTIWKDFCDGQEVTTVRTSTDEFAADGTSINTYETVESCAKDKIVRQVVTKRNADGTTTALPAVTSKYYRNGVEVYPENGPVVELLDPAPASALQ